jgi:RND superfamily putative drug exporter
VFELSVFTINMLTGMGLALGIDYSLFVVSRFREERSGGRDKLDAIAATGATASRAVLFSGCAFVIAMFGLLLIRTICSLAAGAILVGITSVSRRLAGVRALTPGRAGFRSSVGRERGPAPRALLGRVVGQCAGRW